MKVNHLNIKTRIIRLKSESSGTVILRENHTIYRLFILQLYTIYRMIFLCSSPGYIILCKL